MYKRPRMLYSSSIAMRNSMQKCQYNEPDAFDPEAVKKFAEIRTLLNLIEKEKKVLNTKQYKTRHPYNIALEIQRMQKQIGVLRYEIRPKAVT